MPKYTNRHNVPLAVAAFLAKDSYDKGEATISATGLLRPIRQIVLAARIEPENQTTDVSDVIKSRLGTAIHDALEYTWLHYHEQCLSNLGYPPSMIARTLVNPKPYQIKPDTIAIYTEQRVIKDFHTWKVSGEFDIVIDGEVQDYKTTSTYTVAKGNKDADYIMQGSIYRWLNPTIITKDTVSIHFILMDWTSSRVISDSSYPKNQVVSKTFPLHSLEYTEQFIHNKLKAIQTVWDAEDEAIPFCTDTELWRSDPQFKYYKNPDKTTRSTKNFDTQQEAIARFVEDGSVGLIVEKPGQVTACRYCPAFSICKQKDILIQLGDLVIS